LKVIYQLLRIITEQLKFNDWNSIITDLIFELFINGG